MSDILWVQKPGNEFGQKMAFLDTLPLGGCNLSTSKHDGVVDEFGQVWNYPNLYVADGSIIPTALAANPSATISALAERIAYHILHNREPGGSG